MLNLKYELTHPSLKSWDKNLYQMTTPTVNRISECFIKPLHQHSPDANQPIHLTPFELRLLNMNYIQKGLLFAKPQPSENQDFSIPTFLENLRQSLSATLTHFYPLAARFATRKQETPPSYVIYLDPENFSGVKFVYATADDVAVSDILNSTAVPLVVHSFFDLNDAINHDGHSLPLLSIQVTELVDGIFIGGSINHVIADAGSFWHFMALWSETFRSKDKNGDFISRPPGFKRMPIQGCDPIINLPYTHHDEFIERFKSPQIKECFFNFSSNSIIKLKEKANSENREQKISSLQALSALLWRCITRARCRSRDTKTACILAINNRQRLNPPLPDDYFGNLVQVVSATGTVEELMAHGLGWTALRLHEAVKNHSDTLVKKWVQSWSRNPMIIKMSAVFDPNSIIIGSSPRFNMYGCEFGLGKALATRSGCANKADGKIRVDPGRDGGGSIGVEVCLLPEYMKNLECDEEFLSALKSN